ncbi:hypothetical protein OS493_005714 [Desmophyllum pertusum]|uniref:Uncharacterized protein n=1 Tax=Desmophyllum pertusum TaxID=174260 RepID=A0A9X0CHQ8_9CNID|nr:hypothetical protein OS493_005714 [Desmophyllum pertusum]
MKTPTEERAGLSENDQRPECTPPTSFDQGHEDNFGSKGAGVINATRQATGADQTDLTDVVPRATASTAPPLEGHAERISGSTDLQRGNTALGGETAVTALNTNSAEAVRGPVVLEGSQILNSSETRDAGSAEPITTSENSSDNSQIMPDDQKQLGKESEKGRKKHG